MKKGDDVVEILEAFDATRSYRAAARLAGCDHHTVKKYVQLRDAGRPAPTRARRAGLADAFLGKLEELVERTGGKIRADVCHEKLLDLGYAGSERTTRRAVAGVKAAYRRGRLRVYRPWLPEPGLWLEFDWGEGPAIDGARTSLFCAWLAWSRYRVVLPSWDRSLGSLVALLDLTFRLLGGVPTYALTDNEKTITTSHVAGLPVRNPVIVEVGKHYGVAFATCVPADPESKGGVEATVRVAKADLLPRQTNLRPEYGCFAELEDACEAFMARVNHRVHRATSRVPSELLLRERQRLHPVPAGAFAAAAGEERRVTKDALVIFEGARYSVPAALANQRVLVRRHGDSVIITSAGPEADGLREVARHAAAEKGQWRIDDSHYPPAPSGPLARKATPRTELERAFLALGAGAEAWLRAAAQAGTPKIRAKMQGALDLADYLGSGEVGAALAAAASRQRFEHEDLLSILNHARSGRPGAPIAAFDAPSLQLGTRAWDGFGR